MFQKSKYGCMKRPCDRCEKTFQPATKSTRICEKCLKKAFTARMKRNRIRREKMMKDKEKK